MQVLHTASYTKISAKRKVPLLLLCEHALPHIPIEYGNLGLSTKAINSHFGWDIGALEVALHLARKLGCELIYSRISRLVIDFNRRLHCQDLIRRELEPGEVIPGNWNLSPEEIERRIQLFWQPFHSAVEESIEAFPWQIGQKPFLLSIHSFTPEYQGQKRNLDIGLLFPNSFSESHTWAEELEKHLKKAKYRVEINQPYSVEPDPTPYPIHHHACNFGLSYLALEINNSLITEDRKAREMGFLLAEIIGREIL